MAPLQPPETYQQWVSCMQYLAENPADQTAIDSAVQGKLAGRPGEAFLARLSDTVSAMLTWNCKRFLRQLDTVLATGEPEMAVVIAVRLRRNLHRCLLYRLLPFLDEDYCAALEAGFQRQLDAFWADVLRQLRRSAWDSGDPSLEDVAWELSRIHLMDGAERTVAP